jgi:hypothetical protein
LQEWTLLLKIKKKNFTFFFLSFIALKKCTNLPDRCHPLKRMKRSFFKKWKWSDSSTIIHTVKFLQYDAFWWFKGTVIRKVLYCTLKDALVWYTGMLHTYRTMADSYRTVKYFSQDITFEILRTRPTEDHHFSPFYKQSCVKTHKQKWR